jgi:homospermidine synthase
MKLNDIKGLNSTGKKLISFKGRILLLGFGGVGQTMLPMLLQCISVDPKKITVLEKDNHVNLFHKKYAGTGVKYIIKEVTKDNMSGVLSQYAGPGDMVIDLSLNIDGVAIVTWCLEHDVLYTNTSIERWPDEPDETIPALGDRTLYVTHRKIRQVTAKWKNRGATSLVTNGANPGLVSQFTKAALLEIAEAMNLDFTIPQTRQEWAVLMMRTGTKVVHIAERDTQVIDVPKEKGEFVNTWSCEGFWAEGRAPAELGWGTHEKTSPCDGYLHREGPGNAAYLKSPGVATLSKSWVPRGGSYNGFVVQHSESVTMSDYFTLNDREGNIIYRPTVHYVYCPCDAAIASVHEFRGRELRIQDKKRVVKTEIVSGIDELGVLLLGHGMNGWWYGSQMSIKEATAIIPGEGPTTIQVAANMIAGIVWMIQNPHMGYVEPEELPFDYILDIAKPFLGTMESTPTLWTPLADRTSLFNVDIDPRHPWRFDNFRVIS